ncbi:MAG TPA: hypothetical protein VEH30_08105 [Terriglobales bacterium]|nr:hypothetical protein [Terriglobales bacterium]
MSLSLKPSHIAVKAYYETLHEHGQLHIDHESAIRRAFADLLAKCGRKTEPKLTLITEYRIARAKKSSVIVDGALLDLYHLPHGYWEAKDEKDDLAKEVQRKLPKTAKFLLKCSFDVRNKSAKRVIRPLSNLLF